MNPISVSLINYTFPWKIDWSEFQKLSTTKIAKLFAMSHKHVVYYWSVEMGTFSKTKADKFGLFLYYQDGPMATLAEMSGKVLFLNPDNPMAVAPKSFVSQKSFDRGAAGWGQPNFDLKDIDAFKEKYGLIHSCSLTCQITVQIPIHVSAFWFEYHIPRTTVPPNFVSNLFKVIGEKSEFSNIKIVSRGDRTFYCHQFVFELQSPAFAAMFRHPTKEKDTYPFPMMGVDSLTALLQFLYTGQVVLKDVSTTAIIETADAAEQYGMISLKELCRTALWDRVVADPKSCYEIARFASLHDDLKYVKHRAFDVLAENFFEICMINGANSLLKRFGGDQSGEAFYKEFCSFMDQRVKGYFSVQ